MHHLTALAASFVPPQHTGAEVTQLFLRWVHFMAGITWVGLLYFFNLVNVPFMKQVDASMKPKIFQYLTLPALNFFRWSALLTVFVGFWYWAQFFVGPDANRQGVSPLSTIGLFLLLWIAVWAILFFIIKKAASGYVLGAVTAVLSRRRRLGVSQLHARRPGRQPRPLHRHWRRLRHRHAVQRLGHHLAQQ